MSQSNELATTSVPGDNPYSTSALALWQSSTDSMEDLDSFAKSPNTVAGYLNDWRHFSAWARDHGVDLPGPSDGTVKLPAQVPPAVVKVYVVDRQDDLRSATITRHLSAVKHWHNENNLASPTDHPQVKRSLEGLTRKHKYKPRQAGPLRLYDLQDVLPDGSGLKGLRDRALLLWAFWTAQRRSELVRNTVESVEYLDDGAVVFIDYSKTDQSGQGDRVPVNHQHGTSCDKVTHCQGHAPCPVCTLKEWLRVASIKTGPIWRGVDRWDNLTDAAISAQSVSLILKGALETAGANPATYSAHSLRSGFVSTMDEHDVPRAAIRAVTRHKTEAVMDSYSRVDRLLRDSAGAYMSQ